MDYVLGIGFWCNKYKKLPTARVYFKDQFLEEFEINHNPIPDIGHLPIAKYANEKQIVVKKPIAKWPEAKLFVIPYEQVENNEEIKITVEIDNNDNNYTNGFMTKFTSICLKTFFFCRKDFILDREKYEPLVDRHQHMMGDPFSSTSKWSVFFDKYKNTDRKVIFPVLTTFTKWSGNKGQVIDNIIDHTIGGSGKFEVTLTKKHKNWLPFKTVKPWGMVWQQPVFIKEFLWKTVAKYVK
jgi:hypothetical protein